MILNLELLLKMKKTKIVNIKVNLFCNIHLILKFYVGINILEQYIQQYFKKWGIGAKFWWWEFRWVGHQSGWRGAGTLPSMLGGRGGNIHGGLVISGSLIPLYTLWCCKYFFYFQSYVWNVHVFVRHLCFYVT